MLILSAAGVRQALPMPQAIAGMKEAFAALSTGQVAAPLRTRLDLPEQAGTLLLMPAYVAGREALTVKLVTIFPRQAAQGQPALYAAVLVFDAATGRPVALLEGSALTAIRTGAGGGAAADLLARPNARVLGLLGSGVQARAGLEAVCAVRPIEEVRVFSPQPAHAAALVQALAGQGSIPPTIQVAASPAAAVHGADIVYCATTAISPTFDGRDLQPGALVIGVGSYTPQMQEVDAWTVQRARVVVDARASALAEAGDLIIPIQQGLITPAHIAAELGEIVAGLQPGRLDDDSLIFFKSVGVAVQDAVAAQLALANAQAGGLGTQVELV